MNDADYVKLSGNTDSRDYSPAIERISDQTTLRILHAAMGMVTEAAEIMDALKKHIIYGKPLDLVNLREETGDSFWYQALLARAAGFTFEDAKRINIEKLAKRYPEGFTEYHALNRDLGAERTILEQ